MDPVREERIALLEHHASQMQAYKIYALTLVAGFFAVLQSFCALGLGTRDSITLVWVAGGVVAGGLFFCLGRFMWYGAMVSRTITAASEVDQNSKDPLMAQLEVCIGRTALADAQGETLVGRKLNSMVRWLIRLGYNRRRLFACSLVILVAVMLIRIVVILSS
jgi:hypothetical protein